VLARRQANSSLRLPLELDLDAPLPGFDPIAAALDDLAAGKLVVVLDDEDRENEGDLIINADRVTTESMAFLVEYTSGVVCISMEGADLDRLRLPLMVSSAENEEAMYTAFAVTVDLRDGITTGISASDRAKTIRRLADPAASWSDFRRPGHIFPLRYRPGGVLVRPGHTEAAVDLARLSGSFPAGVLCEIVNKEDGSMARTPQLLEFAKQHGLRCITIADLIRYRLRHDALVSPVGQPTSLRTRSGAAFTVHALRSAVDGSEHLAFVHGALAAGATDIPLFVHHERSVADLLDCGQPSCSGTGPSLSGALTRGPCWYKGASAHVRQARRGAGCPSEGYLHR
jgi:3,4-dihydroxy 2-butanone 4-phosphate synthase/GTP cyclohydrolase II